MRLPRDAMRPGSLSGRFPVAISVLRDAASSAEAVREHNACEIRFGVTGERREDGE